MDPAAPPRLEIDPAKLRKGLRAGCGLGVVLLLVFFILGCLKPYTEYLWYAHDVRHPEVLTLGYSTRGTLFTVSFIVSLCTIYFSLRTAFKQSLIYLERPNTMGQKMVTRAMDWVHEKGMMVVKIAAPIFAFFSAVNFSGEWTSWLLSRNAVPFGKQDPLFGLDLSFFVFKLPWYSAVSGYLFSLAVLVAVLTIAVYVGMQMLAMFAKVELGRPQVRIHVSALIALVCFTLALQLWIKTYEFGAIQTGQFTGAGYAAMNQLTGQKLTAIVAVLIGLATLVTLRSRIPYRVPIGGAVVLGATYLIGVIAIPEITQRFVVEPDRIGKEAPYAKRAIAMTRFGFDLDRIKVKDFDVEDTPSLQEVSSAKTTLDNMRLWSPEILRDSFEGSQSFRTYYAFNDVDLDRYDLNGKPTMVMLSPRDIHLEGLTDTAKSWVNMRLQYTHGYGVVMNTVNTSSSSGQPSLVMRNLPQLTAPGLELKEPRIYFSDFRSPEYGDDDQYALVDTKVDEFDYLSEDNAVTHRWTGGRGIPIGGLFAKLAFSIVLGDGNLLVSGNVTGSSRLLMNRSIMTRASKLYPFLRLDDDPYLVVYEGRLVWIMDGYTASDRIPYSEMLGEGETQLNYIRNSVKITIDAYSGEVDAYAIDPNEPVLKAYRAIYPGLVKDYKDFPKGLEAHLRYPEDMLRLQAFSLRQYHVLDTTSFLNNSDSWDIPYQRGVGGSKEPMRPYYVQMRLPDEPKDGFLQILPFSPRGRGTMSGWLAAMCDPGQYGNLVLYKYPQGNSISGPELMESKFNQNEQISNINRQLSNDQSQIKVGNLLVIPIGKSVMYVEPLFLQSRTSGLQSIPELRKVILGLQNKIVVADTYQEALDKLFGSGNTSTAPTGTGTKPTIPNNDNADVAKVREALGLLDQADTALRAGDFAKYGELQKQAKAKLRDLVGN